jgi:phenylalanyl-tRNA synthetase beta chain
LQITQVFTGLETLQIVCGAPNIAVGQLVPLAQIGANLGGDLVIKQAKIRGVDSFGMLCASDELGLGADHSGIMVLDESCEIGKPVSDYLNLDSVFELEITANRGDELSHLGIAREIASLLGKKLPSDSAKYEDFYLPKDKNLFSVEIKDQKLCPQFSAIMVENVKVAPSPDWLQKRLVALGLRPINNIVDITNFIMLDIGQPLHAYDASKVKDKKILVRTSNLDEKIIGLDGRDYLLPEGTVVIADSSAPISIAGVMGGQNSQVDSETKSIILESAEFDSTSIRRTSKKINLSTDASYRFERKINSADVQFNAIKAAKLIIDIAGGEVKEVIYRGSLPEVREIKIEYSKINNLSGLNLEPDQIDKILIDLGFVVESSVAKVPLWRHDVSILQDLTEEVARIFGYEKIARVDIPDFDEPENKSYYYKEYIKDILVDAGFSEIFSYPFLSEKDLASVNMSSVNLIEVSNPIRPENKFLRSSLFPSLLKAVAKNPSFDPVLLFEIGHIFTLGEEKTYLGIVSSGRNAKKYFEQGLRQIKENLALDIEFATSELSRDELLRFKIRKPLTFITEIDLTDILNQIKNNTKKEALAGAKTDFSYREVSKYPPLVRDLAFVVDKDVDAAIIKKTMLNFSQNVLLVDLFDEFSSDKLGANKKSLAYHVYFQDLNRVFNDTEAETYFTSLTNKIISDFKAELRS